jgi:hypothetical protein
LALRGLQDQRVFKEFKAQQGQLVSLVARDQLVVWVLKVLMALQDQLV